MHPFSAISVAGTCGNRGVESNTHAGCEAMATTVLVQRSLDVDRAIDGRATVLICREKPVAGIVNFFAAVSDECLPKRSIVPIDEVGPVIVTDHTEHLC